MNKSIATSPKIQELGQSPDALAQRQAELLALIRQTVPEVMADNQLDVEKLKELLGQERIASDEHYELNWAGKSAARREIQKTSSLTLRPDANNPPIAQHMLIEGENLEVLRVLQKSYYGKVKMMADSRTKCNKDEPGNGWLRMRWHHGRFNRQVEVAQCTSTSAEKNDTKFTAS